MLRQLPAELIVEVYSYLAIQHLRHLNVVARDWKEFFDVNESEIYHNAALLHRFSPSPKCSLSDCKKVYAERSFSDLDGWKAFCEQITKHASC
jgi:hypothetical protein